MPIQKNGIICQNSSLPSGEANSELEVIREITIVDHGRGLQLSTHRARVQDLVPFFQDGSSHREIIRWIPTITLKEIAAVEEYYHRHKESLDEEDRQIQTRNADRKRTPEIERIPENGSGKDASHAGEDFAGGGKTGALSRIRGCIRSDSAILKIRSRMPPQPGNPLSCGHSPSGGA